MPLVDHSSKNQTQHHPQWSGKNLTYRGSKLPTSLEWQKVLDYYRSLDQQWEREIYLKNLNADQRKYLLTLLEEKESPTNYPLHDQHLLNKKDYQIKSLVDRLKKWFKYLVGLVGLILVIILVGNFQSVFRSFSNLPFLGSVLSANESKLAVSDKTKDFMVWVAKYDLEYTQTSADADPDNDGLTNMDEFLLDTNPGDPDSNKNGIIDGQDLLNAIHPATSKYINYSDKAIEEKFNSIVHREVLNYRLQLLTLKKIKTKNQNNPIIQFEKDGKAVVTPSLFNETVDKNTPGNITIDRLNLKDVPLFWTQDNSEGEIEKLLPMGAVHFNLTTVPGGLGNSVIAGSSSDFSWINGQYGNIFDDLDKLEPMDKIEITYKLKNGTYQTFVFLVTSKNIYDATDEKQFENKSKSELSLSTAWGVGTYDKRLVVKATLVNPNNLQ